VVNMLNKMAQGEVTFNTLVFPSQNHSTTVTHTSSSSYYSCTDKLAKPGNLQTKQRTPNIGEHSAEQWCLIFLQVHKVVHTHIHTKIEKPFSVMAACLKVYAV